MKMSAQSEFSIAEKNIDSVLFLQINAYRVLSGQNQLIRVELLDSLCNQHNIYQLKCNCLTHTENLGTDSLISPEKRLKSVSTTLSGVENVLKGDFIDKMVISGELHYTYKEIRNSEPNMIYYLASQMLASWISSPKHNDNLLRKDLQIGGISVRFDSKKQIMVADYMAF